MALTPRSFLRSPMLILALLISAGLAFAGSALFASVFCSWNSPADEVVIHEIDQFEAFRGAGCDHLLNEFNPAAVAWTPQNWVALAVCFESQEDNQRAATVAAHGLSYHPASEDLHNIRGYNLIVLKQYDRAVTQLRAALQAVEPTTGTLQNNLAWAGLYASDRMTLSEARRHYKASLDLGPSCEALHTGMWVEYAVASRSAGTARDEAIDAYNVLRSKYEPCTTRVRGGNQITAYEVAGAGILDGEIYKLEMVQLFERNKVEDLAGFAPHRSNLVPLSLPAMDVAATGIEEACAEISPVKSAVPACRKALKSAMCQARR